MTNTRVRHLVDVAEGTANLGMGLAFGDALAVEVRHRLDQVVIVQYDRFHFRQCDRRRIQRYPCSHCGRSFRTQTFSTTYWLKRPDLLLPLLKTSLACADLRQMARIHGVSPSTVALRLGRAGRHSLAYHELRRPS